jgi:ABC-type antimicrobial peptide transport system permease subunit
MLFGVTTTDATAYAVAGGALAVAGLVAAVIPAVRALRVDPIAALRAE